MGGENRVVGAAGKPSQSRVKGNQNGDGPPGKTGDSGRDWVTIERLEWNTGLVDSAHRQRSGEV